MHNDTIITNANAYTESAGAFDLRTGKQKLVLNPITGLEQPWKLTRAYGCNSMIASEHMLTFRSGAAGYFDLNRDAGTGNLGGFKSGCTSNLIVANGVLNAPDYTRTCSCAYQNQTSLAMVHMPDIEQWSVHPATHNLPPGSPIHTLSLNLGAPGDRRDTEGNLWVEYPALAGDPIPILVETNPEVTYFQQHASSIDDPSMPWIYASGAENVTQLKVGLLSLALPKSAEEKAKEKEAGKEVTDAPPIEQTHKGTYDVKLYMALPRGAKRSTMRVFVQGNLVREISLDSNELPPRKTLQVAYQSLSQADELLSENEADSGTASEGPDSKSFCVEIPSVAIDGMLDVKLESIEGATVLNGVQLKRIAN